MPTLPKKLSLHQLIDLMGAEHGRVCRAVCRDYEKQMAVIPGSSTKHQAWPGGYVSHVEESMNIGLLLHQTLSSVRPLEFSLSQVLFCVFLHDFDKLLRYNVDEDGAITKAAYSKDYLAQTTAILAERYGYDLPADEHNALKYPHGEGDDYHATDRIMLPLATVVHCADVISARVWFDQGRSSTSWKD